MEALRRWELAILLGLAALAVAASAWQPADLLTWALEAAPVLIGAVLLILSHGDFPLTPLTLRLLFLHGLVLLVGAHYTYAQVPVGFWAAETFDLARNHYDRFAHVVQGFVPAILMREILLRTSPLYPGKWLFVVVTSICLAFSAFYEMIEWWSAVIYGASADAFLGTQGDPWDTQWDMFLALVGAVTAQLLLSRAHDRALERL